MSPPDPDVRLWRLPERISECKAVRRTPGLRIRVASGAEARLHEKARPARPRAFSSPSPPAAAHARGAIADRRSARSGCAQSSSGWSASAPATPCRRRPIPTRGIGAALNWTEAEFRPLFARLRRLPRDRHDRPTRSPAAAVPNPTLVDERRRHPARHHRSEPGGHHHRPYRQPGHRRDERHRRRARRQ